MDYFIVAVTTLSGLLFHVWLFMRLRRWMERDQALALAGNDPDRRRWMLEQLQEARRCKIRHADMPHWLAEREQSYPANGTSAVAVGFKEPAAL